MWPLIVSKTVNPNILPGVCKALEKYIYMYELDDVIEIANKNIKDNKRKDSRYNFIKKVGSALRLESSDVDPFNFIEEDFFEEAGPKPKSQLQTFATSGTPTSSGGGGGSNRSSGGSQDPYKDAYAKEKAKGDYTAIKGESPVIGKVDQGAISIEPTWNTVTDQQGRTTAIGVKVVPFIIQNDESLVKLMTLDRYRSSLSKNVHFQARRMLKFMNNLANKSWKATVGTFLGWTGFIDKDLQAGTVTQNWKNDIILQNTAFGDKMFILINKMDLEDDFLSSAGGVKSLFRLGWTSFIVADDMNKVVNFCMKSYKGMCSMVNYGFLYADSRSQSQVFKDIDEISSRSGPLFRLKYNRKNMLTDNLAQQKLDLYSQSSLLSESDFSDIMGKIKTSPTVIASNLKSIASAVKRNDMKTAYTISKKFNPSNKKIDIKKHAESLSKDDPIFKKHYELAYMVFKNSLPGLSEDALVLGTTLYSCVSSSNNDKSYNIKNDLKQIVMRTREKSKINSLDEDDDNFSKDLKTAFIFGVITLVFGGVLFVTLIYGITIMFPTLASATLILAKYATIVLCAWGGLQIINKMQGED